MSCTPFQPVPLFLCSRIRGNREILFCGNTRRGRGFALLSSRQPVMFRPCNNSRLPVSFSRFALSFRSAYPQDVLCLQFLNPSLDYTAKPHNLVTLFTRSVQVTERCEITVNPSPALPVFLKLFPCWYHASASFASLILTFKLCNKLSCTSSLLSRLLITSSSLPPFTIK